jgi:hypothetical protein
MTDRVSTKLFIQHPEDAHIRLCGLLEQVSPDQPTHGRKIALVSSRHYSFLMPVVVNLATFFPSLDSSRNDGVSIISETTERSALRYYDELNPKFIPDTRIIYFKSG